MSRLPVHILKSGAKTNFIISRTYCFYLRSVKSFTRWPVTKFHIVHRNLHLGNIVNYRKNTKYGKKNVEIKV